MRVKCGVTMNLQRLADLAAKLIQQHGPDAPVAAFIYTSKDVDVVSSSVDPAQALFEFVNGGDEPPVEDYLLDRLEAVIKRLEASDSTKGRG